MAPVYYGRQVVRKKLIKNDRKYIKYGSNFTSDKECIHSAVFLKVTGQFSPEKSCHTKELAPFTEQYTDYISRYQKREIRAKYWKRREQPIIDNQI